MYVLRSPMKGQTIFEVADSSILRYLEELKKNNKRSKRRPTSQIRISDGMDNHINADTTPSKVIRVEVKSAVGDNSKDVDGRWTCVMWSGKCNTYNYDAPKTCCYHAAKRTATRVPGQCLRIGRERSRFGRRRLGLHGEFALDQFVGHGQRR